jgi:RNA polymerase sigma-70 factor (ECF subfamily)
MPTVNSFDGLMDRLRNGDGDAADAIVQRFTRRLVALARAHLDTRLKRKADPEDVLQSVFRSFFLRQAAGQFQLEDWNGLWSLLLRITLRKCGRTVAAFRAARRDMRREISTGPTTEESRCPNEAFAREPAPEEIATLTETIENLMRGLDDKQQQIVVLRLQGYTVVEISREVFRTERTVHRVLTHAREVLMRAAQERETGLSARRGNVGKAR